MQRFIDFFTALGQHPNRVNDFVAAASADPALAAKLAAAVDADDNRAALRLMADQQWSRAPGREAPAPAAPSGSRSPMSFEDRLLNDPNIRKSIEESGQAYPAGNAEAVMEAMRRGPVPKRGRPKKATAEDSIRELAKEPAPAPERIAAEFERQIDPTPAERAPTISRWQTPDDEYINLVEQDLRRQPFIRQADEGVMDAAPPEMYPQGRIPPKPKPQVGMSARDVATAVGAGALTAGALDLATRPSTNADLVAESRPGPSVGVTDEVPEPTTLQAPRDYSMEARALINRLNDMRRAAGGEVPEAPAMMQEVNRLLAMGNQARQATYAAAPQDDPSRMFQQAQGLIDQVNQMYRQGMSPNSPEVQRIMAQIRQLQAQGDAIRNRRAG
jgi:hypothetical protein